MITYAHTYDQIIIIRCLTLMIISIKLNITFDFIHLRSSGRYYIDIPLRNMKLKMFTFLKVTYH